MGKKGKAAFREDIRTAEYFLILKKAVPWFPKGGFEIH